MAALAGNGNTIPVPGRGGVGFKPPGPGSPERERPDGQLFAPGGRTARPAARETDDRRRGNGVLAPRTRRLYVGFMSEGAGQPRTHPAEFWRNA